MNNINMNSDDDDDDNYGDNSDDDDDDDITSHFLAQMETNFKV